MKWFKRSKSRGKPIDAVAAIEAEQVEGRGRPDLEGSARPIAPGAKAFMLLLFVAATMLLGIVTWRAMATRGTEDTSAPDAAPKGRIENLLPGLKLSLPKPPPEDKPAESVPATVAATPNPKGSMSLAAVTEPRIDDVTKRRLTSGLQGPKVEKSDSASPPSAARPQQADSGPMADKLRPLKLTAAKASLLGNRDFLLTQGTMIDCAKETKLVSAQAGMITCYATREVRSTNGRVVLIDPGTLFVGYQQSVLAHGQPRIGVVWSRLETPEGVVVNLDSPGTGPLGEAGLDGYIDTHFAERFGAAIMVSLISDFGTWASSRGNNDSGSIRFDSTDDAAKNAVTTVLDNSINIPPTLYSNQGGRVGIFVARDLDFSSVYTLRPTPR
ncbi:type IV secretion system protein VirB10 [Bordetella genomosp. 11]|uniref:Type IV secretion system protein VirB10 n=1 Tax=Bordetella genomosp. 11 TaxID=1416808 RepID=A0A261UL67_9BORD|nr:type IV secretion system protein VirB10 [Bordetella genomosp. 11]OZI62112.1 hypothetical protein CAL28_23085 [Bordetella genomosp. 11]